MLETLKAAGKDILPGRMWHWLFVLRWRLPRILGNWPDLVACARFICSPAVRMPWGQRLRIVRGIYDITLDIPSPHTNTEIISYIKAITSLPRQASPIVVEAGCYKGISTAKFSLAAAAAGKQLVVFDSFQGIPEHNEPHRKTIFGGPAHFAHGEYAWDLDGVKANIAQYGDLECCRFIEGWFEDTLPLFHESVAAIYLDVDLASSTRSCIKYLYPLLEPGGVMFSQDGHLPLVVEVFEDDDFWRNEVGCAKPRMFGLGRKKLVKVVKEPAG